MFLGMDNKWKQKARAIDHLDDFYGYNNSKQKQKMSVFQEKNRNKGKWVLHILKETCEHHPAYIPSWWLQQKYCSLAVTIDSFRNLE
jgi:hypothetical protein